VSAVGIDEALKALESVAGTCPARAAVIRSALEQAAAVLDAARAVVSHPTSKTYGRLRAVLKVTP
jgi:hypothetical protein